MMKKWFSNDNENFNNDGYFYKMMKLEITPTFLTTYKNLANNEKISPTIIGTLMMVETAPK